MSDEGWTWELASKAQDDLASLDADERNRILDEILDLPWRDPPEYGEPLQNSPHTLVRVGEFRLAVTFRRTEQRLVVARIKRRGGAYTADDDWINSYRSRTLSQNRGSRFSLPWNETGTVHDGRPTRVSCKSVQATAASRSSNSSRTSSSISSSGRSA